eukprot:552280_1
MTMLSFLFNAIAMHFVFAANWKEEMEQLIRADYDQAVGFYNGNITILGGLYNGQQRVVFDTTTNSIDLQNDSAININIVCSGQGYIQQNEILYIIPHSGDHFVLYNLANNNMIEWNEGHQLFQHTVNQVGCLAYFNNYLFVVGGRAEESSYDTILNTTQIFNISSDQWLNAQPQMNEKRQRLSCIIHPDRQKLYVFGGWDGTNSFSSIEILAVNNMANIREWESNQNDLLQQHWGSRPIIYGDNIILIGGEYDDGGFKHIQQEQILNTITNQTFWGKMMTIAFRNAATIYVPSANNSIYTFGGYDGGALTTIQSRVLVPTSSPTTNPTINPTIYPTFIPTVNPTFIPTVNPSINPSKTPTDNSSEAPTKDPSLQPTVPPIPGFNPSKTPTDNPSETPTNNPTSDPSKYPTKSPSVYPFTFGVVVWIEFTYTNLTSTDISILNSVLLNVTNNYIFTNANISENCIGSIAIDNNNRYNTLFNVTVLLCDMQSQNTLSAIINNNLIGDPILSQYDIISIDVDVITNYISTSTKSVERTTISGDTESEFTSVFEVNLLTLIVAGFAGIVIIILIVIIIVLIKKRNKKENHTQYKQEIAMITNSNNRTDINIEKVSSVSSIGFTDGGFTMKKNINNVNIDDDEELYTVVPKTKGEITEINDNDMVDDALEDMYNNENANNDDIWTQGNTDANTIM